MREQHGIVLANTPLAEGIFELVLQTDGAEKPAPGQFVNLGACGQFLRRPISVAGYADGRLRLIIQVVGEGTRALSRANAGDRLPLLSPLGRGFDLRDVQAGDTVWCVGGGVGIAPLLYAAEWLAARGARVRSFAGYRSAAHAYGTEALARLGALEIASDDGSLGKKGFVTDAVREALRAEAAPNRLLACGPTNMVRALQPICAGLRAQVSLEAHMACGIGACLVCNCKVRDASDAQGWAYRRVCADGPVFPLEEVEV